MVVVLALRTEVNVDTNVDVDVLVTEDCHQCQYVARSRDLDHTNSVLVISSVSVWVS